MSLLNSEWGFDSLTPGQEKKYNYDLKNYIRTFDVLSFQDVDDVLKGLELSVWKKHSYRVSGYQVDDRNTFANSEEFDIAWEFPHSNLLMSKIWDALKLYVESVNLSWFNTWNGFTPVRINKYIKDTFMDLHCDHIHDIFDGQRKGIPILSVLGVLKDDCKGGELVFFNEVEYKIPAGSIIVFPSSFLYPHKVNKIISGERISFVSWVW
jgi:hypothetical protein